MQTEQMLRFNTLLKAQNIKMLAGYGLSWTLQR